MLEILFIPLALSGFLVDRHPYCRIVRDSCTSSRHKPITCLFSHLFIIAFDLLSWVVTKGRGVLSLLPLDYIVFILLVVALRLHWWPRFFPAAYQLACTSFVVVHAATTAAWFV
jgi:hypothetical protein